MSSDFSTYLEVKGTRNEIEAVLGVLKLFENDSEIYLESVRVEKNSGTELKVSAGGPYGRFGFLEETNLFESISDAAPRASIEGFVSGFSTGGGQSMWCETKNGKPHIFYFDEESDPYSIYVTDMLPYEEFIKIFKINEDDYDHYSYWGDDIEEMFGEGKLYEFSLSEFTSVIPSAMDELAFKNAVESVKQLGIKTREEFDVSYMESIYDPVAKKYLKEGGIYSAFSDDYDFED